MKIIPSPIEFDYYTMLKDDPIDSGGFSGISFLSEGHGFVAGNKQNGKGYAYIEWNTKEGLVNMVRLLERATADIQNLLEKREI